MKSLKKISILSLLILSTFIVGLNYSYADPCVEGSEGCVNGNAGFTPTEEGGNPEASGGRTVEVIVTEDMPGLDCEVERVQGHRGIDDGNPTGRYICQVPVGMEGALLVLGRMIRWLTGFALVSAVLFLVFNGMRLTTAGVDPEAKGKVKSQIYMTLAGIIVLLLSGPILRLIAPWVYR